VKEKGKRKGGEGKERKGKGMNGMASRIWKRAGR